MYVSDDEQRARDEAAEHGRFFRSKAFKIPPQLLIPPGYVTESSLRGFLALQGSGGQVAAAALGDTIAGTPKTVLDRLVADYDYLEGFGFIIVGAGPGNATSEQTRRHARLFQTEVFPALKRYHEQRGLGRKG
jgi:alkanesulfonate monooxygenase SsuD/methylene tetrahydromethanopterin reductase-like flavin-dependent oxidoreductase (luciferase family)